MHRHVCIHGHFYQPPRENPWLEAVERQESAEPYHDWNERITAECYAPNAASRILAADGRIDRIVNNYSRISFNFGPTLAGWLEAHAPGTYAAVLEADRESARRFGGHGNALAQGYNHLILPLAGDRDRETQVAWGLADFAHRFGRAAEGMWLPETAVDLATLERLAAHGVRFTILAPSQARRVRGPGEAWRDAAAGFDTTVPYRVALPSGREIAVFFYHGEIARGVAFEGLLSSGERFASRLLSGFPAELAEDRLMHVATDGETYGHHHRYGEMALSYALHHLESAGLARLTNYGQYLAGHPPLCDAEIAENTAWSCAHGLGRWSRDCGCHAGSPPGWNQSWRAPLREALDGLRDTLAAGFEEEGAAHFHDPWAARDGYVAVLLDRSDESVAAFFARHGRPAAGDPASRVRALSLLEMQRHAMTMYTSCGWFFDDLAGLEGVQILRYAGRAVELARRLWGGDGGEGELLAALARARSNDPRRGTGRDVYLAAVRPAEVDLPRVAAHYAVSSLFTPFADEAQVYCYRVEREVERTAAAGRARLAAGRVRVSSGLTAETGSFEIAAVHFGDHNVSAGVRAVGPVPSSGDRLGFFEEAREPFEHGDLPRVVRLLDAHFRPAEHSLASLFGDDRRRVLDRVLAATLAEVEDEYRDIVRHHSPLLRSLVQGGLPVPRALSAAAELVLSLDLERALGGPEVDPEAIRRGVAEAAALGAALDPRSLSHAFEQALIRRLEELAEEPGRLDRLDRAAALLALARELPFPVDLWQAQNLGHAILGRGGRAGDAAKGEPAREAALLRTLADGLQLAVR
jgi:hypothetical protein